MSRTSRRLSSLVALAVGAATLSAVASVGGAATAASRDEAAAAAFPGAPLADPATFREAMSRLGAAVHIVTTAGKAGRAGFTATAVASVSDTPPTVLVCLNRKSQITPVMRENRVFCVNTLASSEEEAQKYIDMGFTFVAVGSDYATYTRAVDALATKFGRGPK